MQYAVPPDVQRAQRAVVVQQVAQVQGARLERHVERTACLAVAKVDWEALHAGNGCSEQRNSTTNSNASVKLGSDGWFGPKGLIGTPDANSRACAPERPNS